MSTNSEDHIVIDSATREYLLSVAIDIKIDPYHDVEEFLVTANLVFHNLPQDIRKKIIEFQRFGNQTGGILIQGLPIDPILPPTPLKLTDKFLKNTFVSEFCAAVFSTPLGEIFSYAQEKEGFLFQDIFPTPTNRSNISSESSDILLDFHTEVAFHPYLPDHIILYCLRQDYMAEAQTIIASIRNIYPLLSKSEIDLLKKPIFETGIDYSFGNLHTNKGGGPIVSIISGTEKDPLICFDPDLMTCKLLEGMELIGKLNSLAHQMSTSTILTPGDLFIIDNKRSIHGRSSFRARFDGNDRWLQRVITKRDLSITSQVRQFGSRVINLEF